jgi:hypothetical protein
VPGHPRPELRTGHQQDHRRAGERRRQGVEPVEVGQAHVDAALRQVADGFDPPAGGDHVLGRNPALEQRLHHEPPQMPGRPGHDDCHVRALSPSEMIFSDRSA